MQVCRFVGVSLLVLSTAACGGSESQSSPTPSPITIPTPAPTPVPTPTPTPTPTPSPSDPTLLSLSETTQLVGFQGNSGYVRASNGTITYVTETGYGPGTVAVYDPSSGGISYLASGFTVFGMPAITSVSLRADTSQSDATYLVSVGQSNGVSVQVKQLRIGTSNLTLPLLYSSIAFARTSYSNPSTGETLSGIVPFSFGLQFDPQVFRPTGKATYVGLVLAHARAEGGSNAYEISGTMHLDSNYDTGETSGYFELTGRNDITDEIVNFGRINILPSKRDTLDVIISAPDTSGGRLQAFYTGKQAQELMGAFEAQLMDPRSPSQSLRATGAFAAKR
ncbi:hypothetical protein BH11PSE5_BH11PSE5_27030 [soil metagenome]